MNRRAAIAALMAIPCAPVVPLAPAPVTLDPSDVLLRGFEVRNGNTFSLSLLRPPAASIGSLVRLDHGGLRLLGRVVSTREEFEPESLWVCYIEGDVVSEQQDA